MSAAKPERLIRLPEVMHRVGLRKTMIYEMISEGSFPPPKKPGGRVSVWAESEIDQWISRQLGAAA